MVDYNKADVVAFATALNDLIEAVSSDGVGADDFAELINVVTKSAAAVNEIKGVPAGAALHIVGVIADKQGDKLVAKAGEV